MFLNRPDGTSLRLVQFRNMFIIVPEAALMPLKASVAIVVSEEQSENIEVKVFVFVVVPNSPAGTA